MTRVSKWMLPVAAFMLLTAVIGFSAQAAEDAAAKATVNGTVTGADGAAAADVPVRVMAPAEPTDTTAAQAQAADEGADAKPDKARRPKMKAVAETKTDADGKFSIEVPAGDYVINAGARGQGMARQKVTLQAGETKTVDLTLKKGKAGGKGGATRSE